MGKRGPRPKYERYGGRTETVAFGVSPELKQAIQDAAAERGTTVSEYIFEIMANQIDGFDFDLESAGDVKTTEVS